jgi:hypothetical protein
MSGSRPAAWRSFSSEPFEVGEPDFHERTHRLLEAGFAGNFQRGFEALTNLFRVDTLLETVVAGHEQFLNLLARVGPLHKASVTVHISH